MINLLDDSLAPKTRLDILKQLVLQKDIQQITVQEVLQALKSQFLNKRKKNQS